LSTKIPIRTRVSSFLAEPFLIENRIYKPLVILYLLINLIVLRNAIFHDPAIGYDAWAYYDYIQVLSQGRLPTSADTPEFFSPPLAFVPAAAMRAALEPFADSPALNPPNDEAPVSTWLYHRFLNSLDDFPEALAGKFTQLLNVVYSLVTTFFVLKICALIKPEDRRLSFFALFLLGILTVYYRIYSFVRAEPLMIAIIVLSFYRLLLFARKKEFSNSDTVILGLLAGLGMLTRQWFLSYLLTILLTVGVISWQQTKNWKRVAKATLIFLGIVFLIASPFYLHLQSSEGTVAAFNQPFIGVHLLPQWTYYFELGLEEMISDPVRSTLGVRFLPMLYSDIWGDYWAYFAVWGRNTNTNRLLYGTSLDSSSISPQELASGDAHLVTNRFEINDYLGRINIVSIAPTLLLFAGLIQGVLAIWRWIFNRDRRDPWRAIFTIYIVLSLMIYFGFLAFFTYDTPGTIKAGYILHIFPLLVILAADFLIKMEKPMGRAFPVLLVILGLVAIHNFPVLFTRQVIWP
jgi:4-amino-4-deoxy-L-arabinose transferase-like glycosyltransferase